MPVILWHDGMINNALADLYNALDHSVNTSCSLNENGLIQYLQASKHKILLQG